MRLALYALNLRILLRSWARGIECLFYSRVADRRTVELDRLIYWVGAYFNHECENFSKVGWCTYGWPGYGSGEMYAGKRTMCWEAPVGITVYLNNRPTVGMGVTLRGKNLYVRQLQGVRGVSLPPDLKHWPQLFLKGCMEFVEETELENVRLYRADCTLFYELPIIDPEPGERYDQTVMHHRQRMRRRYDSTARQMGFVMKRKWGEWKNPNYTRR